MADICIKKPRQISGHSD